MTLRTDAPTPDQTPNPIAGPTPDATWSPPLVTKLILLVIGILVVVLPICLAISFFQIVRAQ
jgi:hypothetical protein